MMIPLLLLLLAFEPQQQTQMDQIHQELVQQRQQIGRVLELLEKDQKQAASASVCSAETRLVGSSDEKRAPLNSTAVVHFNLFSIVTKPVDACLQAEVRVTASYLDANDTLICSGVVENVATQTSLTESINLEIRPWNFREFVRWTNEPPQSNSGAKRLTCINAEGISEVRSEELARVTSVRVRATVLPRVGGMSTMEIQIVPQR